MLRALALALALVHAPSAFAQWASDAAVNLAVADGDAEQVQPKAVPTPDGGTYISWYEGAGFDVRIQKLDADGNALFAGGGVLVADRGFSSTQDYGLAADADGNALLAFRDDRGGGVNVTAALVTAAGGQPWGADGIRLTATSDFIGAPKITGPSDGGAVVSWSQNGTVHLQKLDASGAEQWVSDITLTPSAGFYFTSDLHAHQADAIVSIVHQTGPGSAPRHLVAQKLDASGALLWGATPVAVFDGGSLQFGNFPAFEPDGSGGGVFSWYDTAGSSLQSYVQRVLTDGTEAFAHNGVAVSTNAARERVAPDVAFEASSEIISVFWVELANGQGLQGVSGQAIDASGARLWTDEGVTVAAPASVGVGSVQTVVGGAGSFAFWNSSEAFGEGRISGARASDDGSGGVEVLTFDVSTTPSNKGRLAAVQSSFQDVAVVVWQDDRSGNDDVYAQNVNADGSLGIAVSAEDEAPASALSVRAWPNPTRGPLRLALAQRQPGVATLAVVDVLGRRIWSRRLRGGAGTREIVWDGRDDQGALVAPGVYIARFTAGGERASARLSVVR